MNDYKIIENVKMDSFNYKRINGNIEELKKYTEGDEYCLGFTNDGLMKFYIDMNKIEKGENTLYIHKQRYEKLYKIPKKIHFIWFSRGRPFNIVNYIAIKAALYHNPEYEIYLHCDKEPNNEYFLDLKEEITVHIIEEPWVINNKPVIHFQHKADYVRLNLLKEMGGIYLDTDFILLKNLDTFLKHSFVMGYERPNCEDFLCNCVIMCEPNSKIVQEWLHIYNNSWGEDFIANWMGHSVMIPSELKKKYLTEMTVFPNHIFFPFLWNDLSILYDEDNGKNYEESVGVHLWDTESCKTDLLPLTVDYFNKKKNTFVRLFKKYVENLKNEVENLEVEDFLVYKGMDAPGNDIGYHSVSIEKLKQICIDDPACIGFNTLGFTKNKIDLDNLIPFEILSKLYVNCHSQHSLYVHKKRI